MVRGRCAGSTRGATGRRPPCPPGVSYPTSASPLGSPAQPGHPGAPHPLSPFPAGPTGGPGGPGESGGPGGPAPRGWTLVDPHRRSPGPPRVPPHRRLRGRPPGAGGAGRTGCAMGTSVPSLAGCRRPPPCRPLGLQRAPRATPGVPALLRLCSTCLHTGGMSSAPWPPAPGGGAPTSGWRPPPLVRRAGWPVEPCAAPVCGPGPPHRGLVLRARARDPGWHRAARPLVTTFASVWS